MEQRISIQVSLLGTFSMRRETAEGPLILTEQDSTSKRLWAFLQYMAVFHQRGVTQEELIEALWGDCDIGNPVNTLKTLLHRGRSAMQQLGFADGKEILLYRRGVYSWSSSVCLELDVEVFDRLCEEAEAGSLDSALAALPLYAGDFLPSASGSPWAISLRTFYHGKYLALCAETAQKLLDQERYEEACRICQNATMADPYDETCHLLLMRAMAAAGSTQAAIQHYTHVAALLMDQLGVSPSPEMVALYRELTKTNQGTEMNLGIIRDQLIEQKRVNGAFFCEFGVFQDIYRLMARSYARSGQVAQLTMIAVLDRDGSPLPTQRLAPTMEVLRTSIQCSLRSGDVFTRYSTTQYLILLPTASYENAELVLNRIIGAFQKTMLGVSTSTQCSVMPVQPTMADCPDPGRFLPINQTG